MTRAPTAGLNRAFRRFLRREEGVASLEFVIMVPVFLAIFMASFESGLLMTRFIMLERALDMTVRELRLGSFVFAEGTSAQAKHDAVKAAVCDQTVMFDDCLNIMKLELRTVSQTTWGPLPTTADCVDRTEDFNAVTQFSTGTENEMMLIRACAVFDPIFPLTGVGLRLHKDESGGYALIASSAFVNEPS